jgi:hypothetical protein
MRVALEIEHGVDDVLEHARPGQAPSLVTWPTRITQVPLCLAKRVSCAAHSRTCATEPGADCSASDHTVWIESITATKPAGASQRGEDALELDLGQQLHRPLTQRRRRARSATCSPDSSPLT